SLERAVHRLDSAERVADLALEDELVVSRRLHPHQQAVEGGDMDARRVSAALERLDERRARPRKRIEDASARRDVPGQERLDELRNELPEVGMQPVDGLRPVR